VNPGVLALVLGVVVTILGIVVSIAADAGGAVLIIIGLLGGIWGVRGILRARGTGIKPPTQP
jgi:hypothetical protein